MEPQPKTYGDSKDTFAETTNNFPTVKDSGKRKDFPSGMRRDIQDNKPRYDLIYLPLLEDWANLMAAGSKKYGANNWTLANSLEELERFKASAFRHFIQFMKGEEDESHHSAVLFNLGAIRYLMDKMKVDIHGKPRN